MSFSESKRYSFVDPNIDARYRETPENTPMEGEGTYRKSCDDLPVVAVDGSVPAIKNDPPSNDPTSGPDDVRFAPETNEKVQNGELEKDGHEKGSINEDNEGAEGDR